MKFLAQALAILIVSATPAFAQNIPTAAEMLKAASDQGLTGVKAQAETAVSDSSAWTFKQITAEKDSDQNKPDIVKVSAQLEAADDLYIKMGEIQGKTLVQQNIMKGGGFGLTGTMAFKRVGTFTRSWEIKFTWDGRVPAGQPLASIPNAVLANTDEGKALAKAIERQPHEQLEKLRAEAEAKQRAEKEQAQAMKAKGEKQRSDAQASLTAIVNKVKGVWMPYTIVTTSESQTAKSDFRGIRIDAVNADNTVTVTLLQGSTASSPQKQFPGSIANGELTFKDENCEVGVQANRNQDGEYYMLFGIRRCGGAPQSVAIPLETRTPAEIERFADGMKQAQQQQMQQPQQPDMPAQPKRPSEQLLDLNRPLILQH